MLRNFKSAKGEGGGAGSAAGAGASALAWRVAIDALVGVGLTSAGGVVVAVAFDRTTMLVLTWMTGLRGDDCGRTFTWAAESPFASFTATTDRRSPRLLHHFQKNQPEHASVTTASRAAAERSK